MRYLNENIQTYENKLILYELQEKYSDNSEYADFFSYIESIFYERETMIETIEDLENEIYELKYETNEKG